MYARQNDSRRSQVKIPENYSGHAFKSTSPYSDMPPPTHLPAPPGDWRQEQIELPPDEAKNSDINAETEAEAFSQEEVEEVITKATEKHDGKTSSIFSSLLPSSILDGNHFPFGHGLGREEILILAIMLLVYLSGEEKGKPDTEFLLMLGLLLFAG